MALVIGIVVLVLVVGALFGVAWWSSGRSRTASLDSTARVDLAAQEARTMKQYRPNGGNGPGPVI